MLALVQTEEPRPKSQCAGPRSRFRRGSVHAPPDRSGGRDMSVPCKFERSLLSHEEYETVHVTHHPAIHGIEREGLHQVKDRLRQMRDRERTLARQKRREIRGKA